MAGNTDNTDHFGFTRVGGGEALSKNGYAALDLDRIKLDDLLWAIFNHKHNGDPALGGPSDPAVLTASTTGGTIPGSATLYYRCSFVDVHGLETYASQEASITTTPVIDAPSSPVLSVNTAGGSLGIGSYNYVITFLDANGGETTTSPLASQVIGSGAANRIRLDLPALPSGGVAYGVYRSRPGQTNLYKLSTSVTTTPYYDTGAAEDQTIIAPTTNTTHSKNSVTVEIPGAFIPEGCASWKIYRSTISGGYTGASLVHWVVEGATDTSATPVTTYVDTGTTTLAGYPQDISSTVPEGSVIDLSEITGSLPLASLPRGGRVLSSFTPGVLTNAQVMNVTESPSAVQPVRLTAFFKTDPTASGVSVTLSIADSAANHVDLICSPSTHRVGDATGYYRVEYPLLINATFQAEDGTRSSVGVEIDNDVAASNEQAVTLDTYNDWVEVDLGSLDTGSYSTFATLRVLDFDTVHTGTDITISVIRTDTSAVVGSPVTQTIVSSNPTDPTSVPADYLYTEYAGPVFTAPGGVDLVLRVTKSLSTSTQSYDVDFMRYTASVPTLLAGPITTTATVTGGTNNGADVNVSLWF